MAFNDRLADLLKTELLPTELRYQEVVQIIQLSLDEDLSPQFNPENLIQQISNGDISSRATIPPERHLAGKLTAKATGVVAGLPLFQAVCYLVDDRITVTPQFEDGARVKPGDSLAVVEGPGRSLLTAERTALNFLGRMSGVASLTRQYADAIAGTQAKLLDTRKTNPGFRKLDKYAVRMGGGENHRMGLYDMVMIKDNHIDGAGGIVKAVVGVREQFGEQYPIEVEVKDLEELKIALDLDLDRIMLDNMSIDMMREAVKLTAGRTQLEASGNVSLTTIKQIAETGVDFISVGALTHSASVLDISMRLVENQ